MTQHDSPKKHTSILIGADHQLWRYTSREWLSDMFPGVVIHEAASGEEGISLAKSVQPSVILMDINLPGMNGIDATRTIMNNNPNARIIVLTILEGEQYKRDALEAGATVLITKREMYKSLLPVLESLIEQNEFARIAESI